MKFVEDPRVKAARKSLVIAWLYFAFYLAVIMGASYLLGITPYIWGLPRWVAIGNIIVPIVFVILLIVVIEKCIPDVPLTDTVEKGEESE